MHNTRIERLWGEVTAYVGARWKDCFQMLEDDYGLDRENRNHIWLLHRLFLNTITTELLDFASTWNQHNIRIPGERHRLPKKMFVMGQWENGFRGDNLPADRQPQLQLPPQLEDEIADGDLADFGVDWDELDGEEAAQAEEDMLLHTWVGNDRPPPNLNVVNVEDPRAALMPEMMAQILELTRQWRNDSAAEAVAATWSVALVAAAAFRPDLF